MRAGPGERQGRHRGQEGRRQEDDQEAARQGRLPPVLAALLLRLRHEYLQKSPQMAVLGKTPADRLKTINQGGLTIRTTLKPSIAEGRAEGDHQGRQDRQQAEPRCGGHHPRARHRQDPRRWRSGHDDFDKSADQHQLRSTRSTAAASRLPVRVDRQDVRPVTALEKGMPLNGTIKVPFADRKKGHESRTRRSSRPSAAPTSRGRSRTTTPAAART